MRAIPPLTLEQIERFWSKVKISTKDECWEWEGRLNGNGYGTFSVKNADYLSHRIAYRLFHPEWDNTGMMCHRCANRKCCHPAHLYPGTNSDNQQDIIRTNLFEYARSLGLDPDKEYSE